VRATHDFLTEADIVMLRPLVDESLSGDALELWLLIERGDVPIGFMALAGDDISALVLEPARRGQGGGRKLVAHAQALRDAELTVDCQRAEQRGARVLRRARLCRGRPLAARRRRSAVPAAPHASASAAT
jgi:GNAT superfamily N-acetyltransferase